MDKIVCVGKNYPEHAKELGDAVPEKPVLFLKPPSVLREASAGGILQAWFPAGRGALHPECEIVLRLSAGGENLTEQQSLGAIGWVTLGLDMTLREVQADLKKRGHPWEVGKVFRDSAIVGPWIPVRDWPGYGDEEFRLFVGGALRQRGRASEMSLSPQGCVSHASRYFPLQEGDLVFTGTPAGVGPVHGGDEARLEWGRLVYCVRW